MMTRCNDLGLFLTKPAVPPQKRRFGSRLSLSVEVAASPERVFRALASNEITEWWVRPGVFDTPALLAQLVVALYCVYGGVSVAA
jgi:hypothetical protein